MKVAIVGTAKTSRHLAPFNDNSWDIWGVSDDHDIPRWNAWFDIHNIDCRKNQEIYPGYWQWLTQQTKPVYMQDVVAAIPGSVKFPKDELIQRFGGYFTNSVSWMLAFAIQQDAEAIALYGVDMAVEDDGTHGEYSAQRPSCEYFIGLARGMGIEVIIPNESELLKAPGLYGYETAGEDQLKIQLHTRQLERQKKKALNEREAAHNDVMMFEGALANMQWVKRVLKNG